MRTAADVLDRGYEMHPDVSIRPESFGALLYHFGTRRLSFLKDPKLVDVVRRLPDAPDARTACVGAGVGPGELASYARSLATLADTDMIRERS